jgi:uncharacterized protein (TIGR00251 family)
MRLPEGRGKVLPLYPAWLHPQGNDVVLDVLVSARATRTRVMGVDTNRLKVQLAAPPTDDRVNQVLVRFLADTLKIARAQVEITGGPTSLRKTVRVQQVLMQRVLLTLSPRGTRR